MRIASFRRDGKISYGLLEGDELADLPELDPQLPPAIGVNYADHAAETGQVPPPYPTVFAKFASTLAASGDPIVLPSASARPDYEGELAVVIGRPDRHITEQDAPDHVAGYTAFNDVSARDFQGHTSRPGDTVVISIDGVTELTNEVIGEAS